MDLSVVIPLKDEKDNLRPLHSRLRRALDPLGLSYEIVFVDDGSTDASRRLLTNAARGDSRIKVVALSRNFGHQAALGAALDHATGEAIVKEVTVPVTLSAEELRRSRKLRLKVTFDITIE